MDQSPLVTICVPVYNGEAFIEATLRSVLAQTYKNIEILVLDNHSTDGTPRICARFADKDPRVRVIRQTKNLGALGNWNAGVKAARGDLVAIYHADDIYEKTIVAAQVNIFTRHPKVSAVFTRSSTIDAKGKRIGADTIPDKLTDRQLSYDDVMEYVLGTLMSPFISPSCMARKTAFAAAGAFNKRFDKAGDADMYLRLAMVGNIYIIGKRLLRYRHFENQASITYSTTYAIPNQIFGVIDALLKRRKAGNRALLNTYNAYRDWDYTVCAINILASKSTRSRTQRALARKYLRKSLTWRRIKRAHKEPLLLGITTTMLTTAHARLGLDRWLARKINAARRTRHLGQ